MTADAGRTRLPDTGTPWPELERELDEARVHDIHSLERFTAGNHYSAGADVETVAERAYLRYFWTNAMYTSYYPSITRFEREVIAFTADILHGPEATGSITSGGSESILMAVKVARDRARARRADLADPEIVVAKSAHPAFWKGGEYFGLRTIAVPLADDLTLDPDAVRAAVTDRTVLIVGSAPSLTLGMVDPIPELAAIALERGIHLHVDGCVGGFFLPWVERLGAPLADPLPVWDFRTAGVSSISADLHKFGYAAKGASVLMSRDPSVFGHQPFRFGGPERPEDWYVTPSMTGTRPGGAVAAAWAVMRYLGRDGYLDVTRRTMAFIRRLQAGIEAIEGLKVLGRPAMSLFVYTSEDPALDIFAVAHGLEERGWMVARDEWPRRAIRFMHSAGHEPYMDRYVADLAEVASDVRAGRLTATGRARYT